MSKEAKSFSVVSGTSALLVMASVLLLVSTSRGQENTQPQSTPEEEQLEEILEGFEPEATGEPPEPGLDEILGGFEEEPAPEPKTERIRQKPLPWDLSGSVKAASSINIAHEAPPPAATDHRGLSRLRLDADLDLEITFSEDWRVLLGGHAFYDFAYRIQGRDAFTPEVLDLYENEIEFDETFAQGKLHQRIDLKVGRQIMVWGKSDNVRVTDVLNPLDNREPGLVDIDDLRLPVFMTRLDYYIGPWNLTTLAVHEVRFNKDPVFGSDFFPLNSPPPPEEKPASHFRNTQYGAALNGIFTGWDLSFYAARFFNPQTHFKQVSPTETRRAHSWLTMVGAATNLARGNWLFKAEAAYLDGFRFFALPGTRSRLDLLVGADYTGFSETTLSAEIVNRHLFDFDNRLKDPPDNAQEDEPGLALRYQADFLHDTLHLVFVALIFGPTAEDGAVERASIRYDWSDYLSLTAGLVAYQSGDLASFRTIGDNDRLFFEAVYSF